jgi:hypothetical protein
MILDVDPDAIRGSVSVQRDLGVSLSELERVLQLSFRRPRKASLGPQQQQVPYRHRNRR